MGHIPREIYRHVYYFIKTEGGFVNGSVISTKYCPSLIPSGGLEILLFKFRARNRRRLKKWKFFFDSLYNYDYIEVNDEENSEEEEAAIVSEKPANHTTAGQSKLVSYTDCSSEEEDLHVVIVFDEPIDLAIN